MYVIMVKRVDTADVKGCVGFVGEQICGETYDLGTERARSGEEERELEEEREALHWHRNEREEEDGKEAHLRYSEPRPRTSTQVRGPTCLRIPRRENRGYQVRRLTYVVKDDET